MHICDARAIMMSEMEQTLTDSPSYKQTPTPSGSNDSQADGATMSASDIGGPSHWQVPPLRPEDGWIGGVCAAIAAEVGVSPSVIRFGFGALALQGGWGVVLYGLAWIWLGFVHRSTVNHYLPQPKARSQNLRYLGVGLVVLGLMLAGQVIGFGVDNPAIIPLGLIGAGGFIAWGAKLGQAGAWSTMRVVLGVVVAASGAVAGITRFTSTDNWLQMIPAFGALAALLVVAVPSIARIGRELDDERAERVRADERAKVAAHLHDSVLQTLTLIQKGADDPALTARLARQQERELRGWLYGTSPSDPALVRMEPALQIVASVVERRHQVQVNVVVVGDDNDLDPQAIRDLMAATQEAVTNAAKHAKVETVDVFAEVGADGIEVFVRDDGCGFDVDAIDEDRHGVTESIIERMKRIGGRASVHSAVGEGTEIELFLPLGLIDDTDEQTP